MVRLRVFVYGDRALPVVNECVHTVIHHGAVIAYGLSDADVAIAPLLQKKLSAEYLYWPKLGTLIFHPSLLPRHRGRDAIKWAYRCNEPYTGATWFWANEGLDTGDICEQEVLEIQPGEKPGAFYQRAVVPSAAKMLGYIVDDLNRGVVRRRPQRKEAATYEPPIRKGERPFQN